MELPDDFADMIYLDSAASVYPKPKVILDSMLDAYSRFGVNPGRSGYDMCLITGALVDETRDRLTKFFGGRQSERLCFCYNASDALNILINGLVEPGDHVITTTVEHNSVIRPLNHLRRDLGVELSWIPFSSNGRVDPAQIVAAFKANTKLVVVNHGSNVIGTVQPVGEIGRLCRERGVLFVIDTAQTAGIIPINVERMCVDALAFTGHKSLLAPTGIGGLYVREGIEVRHTRAGGTGVRSAYPFHLEEYPYRLEVGTQNVLGIAGLLAAQEWIEKKGLDKIYAHEMALFSRLQQGLSQVERVHLLGTTELEQRLPVLSFTIDGIDPADVGTRLDVDYNIATRTGLHCAPLIHEQMGTSPRGSIRMSVGPLNEQDHIDQAIAAVTTIAGRVN